MKILKKTSLLALASVFAFGPIGQTMQADPASTVFMKSIKGIDTFDGSWTKWFKELIKPKVLAGQTVEIIEKVVEKPVEVIKVVIKEVTKEPEATFTSTISNGINIGWADTKTAFTSLGNVFCDHSFFFSDMGAWMYNHPFALSAIVIIGYCGLKTISNKGFNKNLALKTRTENRVDSYEEE